MTSRIEFDHLNLDECSRRLMLKACASGRRVYLSPMDKGLSGSSVWLAKWILSSGAESGLHVFKIGPSKKIKREHDAARDIVCAIEPRSPGFIMYTDDDEPDKALLRQAFLGSMEKPQSLRTHIENCRDAEETQEILNKLYNERMSAWHRLLSGNEFTNVSCKLSDALDWWVARTDLAAAVKSIGEVGIVSSIKHRFDLEISKLEAVVMAVGDMTDNIYVGPVHGDLHAQNVLVDRDGDIELIDFGWTAEKWRAVDFLMMECSLKFLVTPPFAQLEDLILMDETLDKCWGHSGSSACNSFLCKIYGQGLAKIAAGVAAVRRAAIDLKAVDSEEQYRRGLILLTAGLASMPTPINRVFLLHSLAYQVKQMVR